MHNYSRYGIYVHTIGTYVMIVPMPPFYKILHNCYDIDIHRLCTLVVYVKPYISISGFTMHADRCCNLIGPENPLCI